MKIEDVTVAKLAEAMREAFRPRKDDRVSTVIRFATCYPAELVAFARALRLLVDDFVESSWSLGDEYLRNLFRSLLDLHEAAADPVRGLLSTCDEVRAAIERVVKWTDDADRFVLAAESVQAAALQGIVDAVIGGLIEAPSVDFWLAHIDRPGLLVPSLAGLLQIDTVAAAKAAKSREGAIAALPFPDAWVVLASLSEEEER